MELHGPMLPTWYASMYKDEKAYPVVYDGVSPTDPDSDGDGVRDGADDQDHDDIPNYPRAEPQHGRSPRAAEDDPDADLATARDTDTGPAARVNPYNPCLPYTDSRTCPISVPFATPGPRSTGPRREQFFVYY